VEFDSLLDSRWEISGFVNYFGGLVRVRKMRTIMGTEILARSGARGSVAGAGLLDVEPMMKRVGSSEMILFERSRTFGTFLRKTVKYQGKRLLP